MTELPFKRINLSNWSEPDPASAGQAKGKDESGWQYYTGEDYLKEIEKVALNPNVPKDISEQIELAKAICTYGYYFYPLFTVGMERAILSADSATVHMCKKLGGPKNVTNTFEKRIDWLAEHGLIDEPTRNRWHNVRKYRNYSSHPKHVTFMTPVMALGIMERVAEAIDSLFAKDSDNK